MLVRYLEKEEEDRSLHKRLSRRSVDFQESPHASLSEQDVKKRCKNQVLARSLHVCQRSQIQKWVDEEDQKFLLMKCVNDVCLGGLLEPRF